MIMVGCKRVLSRLLRMSLQAAADPQALAYAWSEPQIIIHGLEKAHAFSAAWPLPANHLSSLVGLHSSC